jgi:hypothetical protein
VALGWAAEGPSLWIVPTRFTSMRQGTGRAAGWAAILRGIVRAGRMARERHLGQSDQVLRYRQRAPQMSLEV